MQTRANNARECCEYIASVDFLTSVFMSFHGAENRNENGASSP